MTLLAMQTVLEDIIYIYKKALKYIKNKDTKYLSSNQIYLDENISFCHGMGRFFIYCGFPMHYISKPRMVVNFNVHIMDE